MCYEFDRNRRKLSKLMRELGTFTKERLIAEFEKQNDGNILIDGYQSISSYVDQLTEFGNLDKQGNLYRVVNRKAHSVPA